MLKCLRKKHHVTYLCFKRESDSPENSHLAHEYCDRLITVPWEAPDRYSARFYAGLTRNLASRLPYAIEKYRSEQMTRQLECAFSRDRFDAVICDFLNPSVNLPATIPFPSLLFQHNVESAIWERHYRNAHGLAKKAYFYNQFKKMEDFERSMVNRFDAVVAVSDSDSRLMMERFNPRHIYSVPTGVDTAYFAPSRTGYSSQNELVFTGSMDYLPNEDAVIYFSESILPLLKESLPDVSLTVVGRNPTPRVISLAALHPEIRVTGTVDDVRPYLARAAAAVVPIRIGGGTRLKIFEAMAMGKPVISTTVGAEGLPVIDGQHAHIADDPREFATRILQILSDSQLRNRLSQEGRKLVTTRFGWDAVTEVFSSICEDVVSRQKRFIAA